MKNYCKNCGERLDPNSEHKCTKTPVKSFFKRVANFFLSILIRTGVGDTQKGVLDYFESDKTVIPESISPDSGESPVKQYNLAVLRSRLKCSWAKGRLTVTNKRLLFRANGFSPAGKTTYQHEFAIDEIAGIEVRKDYRFMIMDLLIGLYVSYITGAIGALFGVLLSDTESIIAILSALAVGIGACIPFFTLYKKYFLKMISISFGTGVLIPIFAYGIGADSELLSIATGIAVFVLFSLFCISLFLSCFKPNLVVEVKTSGGTPGVQIKHKYTSLFVWKKMEEYSGFAEILPAEDADLAITELGSLINDIKTLGDLGAEKWRSGN